MTIGITELPAHERPRERLMLRGLEALSERELLALVLRHGHAGASSLDLAESLLRRHGGAAGLARTRTEDLAQHLGIGATTAAAVVAAFRLGQLAESEPMSAVLRGPEDVASSVNLELARHPCERVIVLICDARNRLSRTLVVTDGGTDRAPFPVREILSATLRNGGRAFAVAHNHPSGDPTPSESDRRATSALVKASSIVGLRFLGHVVVADRQWQSVATLD